MSTILYIIGGFCTFIGIMMVIFPQVVIKVYKQFMKVISIKVCGVFDIVLGTVIIICTHGLKDFWIITILGILAQLEGVLVLLFPKKSESMLNWWLERDPVIWRVISICPIVYGALIIVFTLI